jgi:G patch domain-containing protein 1
LTEYQTDTSVQADAAKMKMFGALTRTTEEWRPSGLLCKRFNIMNPYKGTQDWDKKIEEKKAAIDIFMEMELPNFMPELAKAKEEAATNKEENKDDNKEDGEKKDDDEEEEIKEEEKPSIDLFKAIFEASDEEDEDEENNEENDKENANNDTNEVAKEDQEQITEEPKNSNDNPKVEEDKVMQPERTEEEIRAELKEDLIKEAEERMKSKLMKPLLLEENNEEEEGLNFKSLTTFKKKTPVMTQDKTKDSEIGDGIARIVPPVEEKTPDSDQVQNVAEEKEEVIGPELPPGTIPGTNSGLSYIMPMNIDSSGSSDSSASSDEESKRKHKDKKDKRDKKHKKSKKRKHKDKKDKKDKKEKHKRKKQRTS